MYISTCVQTRVGRLQCPPAALYCHTAAAASTLKQNDLHSLSPPIICRHHQRTFSTSRLQSPAKKFTGHSPLSQGVWAFPLQYFVVVSEAQRNCQVQLALWASPVITGEGLLGPLRCYVLYQGNIWIPVSGLRAEYLHFYPDYPAPS